MFNRYENELMENAIKRDLKTQVVIAIEELSELQKVLCKILRYGLDDKNKKDLYNEFADVEIMMWQIKLAFGLSENLLQKCRSEKIIRLETFYKVREE